MYFKLQNHNYCLRTDIDKILPTNRYVKLFVRSSKLLRHYFCVRNSKLYKKVKLKDHPISLFVNRSHSFMDQ